MTKENYLNRPNSYPTYYSSENNKENSNRKFNSSSTSTSGNNNGSLQNRLDESLVNPTQIINLMTTVPQNIAARNLGDKHTPTRNSLRHSRMIVMYRNGQIPRKYLPFVIKHYRLVKSMKVITIILGLLMCLLSVWLILWSPTLNTTDFPYWSAIPVLFSGIIGCFFLGFCPRPYPNKRLGWHYYFSKYVSIITTSISILASMIVITICVIHLIYLHKANCTPHDKLNTTCVCSIIIRGENNSTNSSSSSSLLFNDSYHYQDFTCDEVNCFLLGVIATSIVINILTLVLEIMYLYVQCKTEKKYIYTKIPLIRKREQALTEEETEEEK